MSRPYVNSLNTRSKRKAPRPAEPLFLGLLLGTKIVSLRQIGERIHRQLLRPPFFIPADFPLSFMPPRPAKAAASVNLIAVPRNVGVCLLIRPAWRMGDR